MTAFAYRAGLLHAEKVSLTDLAGRYGTPAYVYAASAMRQRLEAYRSAFAGERALVCYALKANPNLAIVRLLAASGAGADTVSGGEIARALAAGVPPHRIVFAGVAKTDDEIRLALGTDILQLNVESVPELMRIAELAAAMGRTAPVALRVNPDVAADTHDKISTGRRSDKFGIPLTEVSEVYRLAARLRAVTPVGLHLHIGSQITSLDPFEAAYAKGIELFRNLRADGLPATRLDLGGGIGVTYRDETPIDLAAFGALVRRLTAGLDAELLLEPGRALVAEAGVLVASVIYVKETAERRFVILDAGMNVLLRPAMYGAFHAIMPVRAPAPGEGLAPADVVGPICESSDVLGRERLLPPLRPGDLVAVAGVGAYGAAMASDYNTRPSAVEILVDGAASAVIKRRRLPEAQFADETIPDWLAQTAAAG